MLYNDCIAACWAAARALELALDELDIHWKVVRAHNARLRSALSAYPKLRINSPGDALPHILNLSVAGVLGTAAHAGQG